MNNQPAQTMPELPASRGYLHLHNTSGVSQVYGYTADQMHQYARDYAAALSQTAGVVEVKRDREGDRLRFPDPDFNAWLDAGISDAGHTVYDSLSSIEDAWQGWHGHVLSVMSDENPVFDDLAIDSPTTAASVSERARELLAAEYERANFPDVARTIREGGYRWDSIRALELRAIEQALTQQRGECEDAHKFRRLAQLLDGFDFRLGRNALMPPATYLDSVEITCEFQPGVGQSVIDAIVDVLTTEKRND